MTFVSAVVAVAGLALAGPASAASSTDPADVGAAADPWKPCSAAGSVNAPTDKDGGPWGKYFRNDATKLRKTPSTGAEACAGGQESHVVDLHCYRLVNGTFWNYVRDSTTGGWAGWVRDQDLTTVSGVPC
jgi:hypothetical protein